MCFPFFVVRCLCVLAGQQCGGDYLLCGLDLLDDKGKPSRVRRGCARLICYNKCLVIFSRLWYNVMRIVFLLLVLKCRVFETCETTINSIRKTIRKTFITMKKNKNNYVITSQQRFDAEKPQYNGFACGYGTHGDKKYNRGKEKRNWLRENDSEQ